MTRNEKIGGAILGLALFAGLFYLIYDSFMATPAGFDETALTEDFDTLGETGLDEDVAAAGEEESAPEETPEAVTGLP